MKVDIWIQRRMGFFPLVYITRNTNDFMFAWKWYDDLWQYVKKKFLKKREGGDIEKVHWLRAKNWGRLDFWSNWTGRSYQNQGNRSECSIFAIEIAVMVLLLVRIGAGWGMMGWWGKDEGGKRKSRMRGRTERPIHLPWACSVRKMKISSPL